MVVNDTRQEFAHGQAERMRAHDRGNIARIQTDVLHMRCADAGRALKDKAGQEDADKEQIEPGTARVLCPLSACCGSFSALVLSGIFSGGSR